MPHEETTFKAHGVQSLTWMGETLVDFATGHYWDGNARAAGESWKSKGPRFGERFDAAIVSPSKNFVVIYEKLGTKALILKGVKLIREINRSYYQSEAFEYPIAIALRPDGREILIHCPDNYSIIRAEDIETGEVIQDGFDTSSIDYFHSCLTVSPDQNRLISAGWHWHPFSEARLYDIVDQPFRHVTHGKNQTFIPTYREVETAVFLDSDSVYVATSREPSRDDEAVDTTGLGPNDIALWSIAGAKVVGKVSCGVPIGQLMPISPRYVVSFHTYPRLWDMEAKCLAFEWSDIDSGRTEGSIIWHADRVPIAKDGPNKRFAVAHDNSIMIVELDLP